MNIYSKRHFRQVSSLTPPLLTEYYIEEIQFFRKNHSCWFFKRTFRRRTRRIANFRKKPLYCRHNNGEWINFTFTFFSSSSLMVLINAAAVWNDQWARDLEIAKVPTFIFWGRRRLRTYEISFSSRDSWFLTGLSIISIFILPRNIEHFNIQNFQTFKKVSKG